MRLLGSVLVALLLTACSGGEEAAAPASKASADPWPPSSVLAVDEPTLPPIDAPATKATARKYVSYLIDEIDYALRTTYPDSVLRHGMDDRGRRCEVCDTVVGLAETAQDARQLYEFDDWGGYLLLARELPPVDLGDPATYWRLRLQLWQPEMQVVDDDGEVVHTTPARTHETVLVLGYSQGQWRIFSWDIVGSRTAAA